VWWTKVAPMDKAISLSLILSVTPVATRRVDYTTSADESTRPLPPSLPPSLSLSFSLSLSLAIARFIIKWKISKNRGTLRDRWNAARCRGYIREHSINPDKPNATPSFPRRGLIDVESHDVFLRFNGIPSPKQTAKKICSNEYQHRNIFVRILNMSV